MAKILFSNKFYRQVNNALFGFPTTATNETLCGYAVSERRYRILKNVMQTHTAHIRQNMVSFLSKA